METIFISQNQKKFNPSALLTNDHKTFTWMTFPNFRFKKIKAKLTDDASSVNEHL